MMRRAHRTVALLSVFGGLGVGCDSDQRAESAESPTKAPAKAEEAAESGAKLGAHDLAPTTPAKVGEPAPTFSLKDLSGKVVSLGDYAGKIVVLEWFNPECPFVKAAHEKGSLKGLAAKHHERGDVVWLAINSGGQGRQGHGVEKNRTAVEGYSLAHPVLLDETGSVGKAYGATNTPHMFIIDKQGKLAYRGAIDNSPDGEGEAAPDGNLVNYVTKALSELGRGAPVSTPETKAYGCSVKYAS